MAKGDGCRSVLVPVEATGRRSLVRKTCLVSREVTKCKEGKLERYVSKYWYSLSETTSWCFWLACWCLTSNLPLYTSHEWSNHWLPSVRCTTFLSPDVWVLLFLWHWTALSYHSPSSSGCTAKSGFVLLLSFPRLLCSSLLKLAHYKEHVCPSRLRTLSICRHW